MNNVKKAFRYILLVTGLWIMSVPILAAPDYAREKRWHDEIIPSIIVGEPVYLEQKNKHRFLSIYTQADSAKTGLVVVHGMGIHPDWGMVNTLREGLAEYGFSTLSIQMPVLAADAKPSEYPAIYPDAAERLKIAVNYMKEAGYPRVVIVSHSNGSRMSRVYMVTKPAEVDAWASLSLTQEDNFTGVKAPVLDLYGSDDLPHVLSAVEQRKQSLAGNKGSRQVVVNGADHFYAGYEDAMVRHVKEFLETLH